MWTKRRRRLNVDTAALLRTCCMFAMSWSSKGEVCGIETVCGLALRLNHCTFNTTTLVDHWFHSLWMPLNLDSLLVRRWVTLSSQQIKLSMKPQHRCTSGAQKSLWTSRITGLSFTRGFNKVFPSGTKQLWMPMEQTPVHYGFLIKDNLKNPKQKQPKKSSFTYTWIQ